MIFFFSLRLYLNYSSFKLQQTTKIMSPIMILLILLLSVHTEQNAEDEQYDLKSTRDPQQLTKQWQNYMFLTSFKDTIQRFPYLKKNMRGTIMTEMQEQKPCFNSDIKIDAVRRFAILDNKVYNFNPTSINRNSNSRTLIFTNYLQKITKRYQIPDLYFFVYVEDRVYQQFTEGSKKYVCQSLPMFAFNKNTSLEFDRTRFLLPDAYVLDEWICYYESAQSYSRSIRWEDKIPKLFFRGAPSSPHYNTVWNFKMTRKQVFRYFHRTAFVFLSLEHPDLVDAKFSESGGIVTYIKSKFNRKVEIISWWTRLKSQLKYKYILSADGYAAAWRRPTLVLHSNSILFKTLSDFTQWYYDKLIPDKHFVLLDEDLSNIFQKMQELNNNDTKCKQIIKNANEFAQKQLTLEALQDFGAQALKKWVNIQKLNLTKEEKLAVNKGADLQDILIIKRKQQLQQLEQQYAAKWRQMAQVTSFEGTIESFPILKDNFNPYKIAKIYYQSECSANFVVITIIDNKVSVHSKQKNNNLFMADLLQNKIKEANLPDMIFLFQPKNKLTQSIQKKGLQTCSSFPVFTTSKNIAQPNEQTRLLIPDFTKVDGWSSKVKKIKQKNQKNDWQNKKNKAFFLGEATGPSFGQPITQNTDILSLYHRGGYVLLSEERPDLIQAKFIKTESKLSPLFDKLYNLLGQKIVQNQPSVQKVNLEYKYQLSADGFDTSQELPQILFSNSVLLKPFSQRVQWFYDKMIPNKHFITLSTDLSNLITKISKFDKQQENIKQIVKNANIFSQEYLTEEKLRQFLVESLKKYAAIQKLQLSEDKKEKIKNGVSLLQVLKSEKQYQMLKISNILPKRINSKQNQKKQNLSQNKPVEQESTILYLLWILFVIPLFIYGIKKIYLVTKSSIKEGSIVIAEQQNL